MVYGTIDPVSYGISLDWDPVSHVMLIHVINLTKLFTKWGMIWEFKNNKYQSTLGWFKSTQAKMFAYGVYTV